MTSLRIPSLRPMVAIFLAVVAMAIGHASPAHAAATITVVNQDGPGEGFNDPTPVTPVGGNTGTTLGQQRLIAFQHAATLWGARLNSSVEIRVGANFDPLTCGPTSAVLGSAGPENFFRDFTGAPVAGTWFPVALANALRGIDLDPPGVDIGATFNSTIGTTCPFPNTWYYGLDGNPGPSQTDFATVVLHELGHGLGMVSLVNLTTGAKALGFNDTYMRHLEHHGATPPDYPSMTDAQRVTASTATGDLHWTGTNVRTASGVLAAGAVGDHVRMFAPSPVQPGSSVSHFDTALSPNQLMEPSYTGPLLDPVLELPLFRDLGWTTPGGGTSNDNFANATTISGASGTTTGNNATASRETGEPVHFVGTAGNRSVWWRWTAPATGQATFNTTGTGFDAVLAVYAGSAVGSLTQIVSDNNNGGANQARVGFHAVSGATYFLAVDGATAGTGGAITLGWSLNTTQGGVDLVAAVLPYARSVQVGQPATAFATIINTGAGTATNCSLQMSHDQGLPGLFQYQTASPANTLTGTPNTPANIAAGGSQQWVFGFTPSAAFAATDIRVVFDCESTQPVNSSNGLNTFLLSSSSTPVPDMVAISATLSNNGILELPGAAGSNAFATAAVNIGAAGSITATVDTGGATLPLAIFICQTNPGTGACLSPPATSTTSTVATNETVTYAIFGTASGTIAFNPAASRIFLRLSSGGVTRGATSVAVRTQTTSPGQQAAAR